MYTGLDLTKGLLKAVNAGVLKENKRAAVEAFCLISKHTMILNERQYVLQLFNVLPGTSKLSFLAYHYQKNRLSLSVTGQVQLIGLSGGQGLTTSGCFANHSQRWLPAHGIRLHKTPMEWKGQIHWPKMVTARRNRYIVQCNPFTKRTRFLHCSTLQLMVVPK